MATPYESVLLLILANASLCSARIGLTGIESFPNQPFCATACYGSLSSYRLDCSVIHGDENEYHAHVVTSPECRADNEPFLTSLAWCMASILIILNVGFGLPILLTWLGYLLFFHSLYERLRLYIVHPSLIGRYHIRTLPFSLGNVPTVGQALYIGLVVILNIFQNKTQQITGYLMYRIGVLSFAMAPLLILFSGRNLLLQWITNWPHSTFILLHRWIARLFTLQALLHTILAVAVYKDMGIYDAQAALPSWAWGVVGTLFACVMVVVSGLYFRRLSYEIFLLSHIFMAVLVIVGSWYHVVLRFETLSGFTMWLWTACAVWFFDRLVRVLRILRVGVLRSKVTNIGDGYVRVDIQGVRSDSLLTLVEGLYQNTSLSSVLKYDRVLFTGGGIGITGLLPLTETHPNVKLCWTVRQGAECLVRVLNGVLQGVADKHVKVGQRTDIDGLVRNAVEAGWARIGVVACGPGGLCDDVRAAVVSVGRKHKTIFELQVDAYSW
ncbi:hypothetical protein ACJ41O_001417 [Fusarium nematophilum]